MLDQNTDRMWYVIGAVIVGAALIFLMNGTFPTLFANIGETFEDKVGETTEMTDGITPVKRNPNILKPEYIVIDNSRGVQYDEKTYTWSFTTDKEIDDVAALEDDITRFVRIKEDAIVIPYGEAYTVSYEIRSSQDLSVRNDINVITKKDGVVVPRWNGNNSDDVSKRVLHGKRSNDSTEFLYPVVVKKDQWTTISFTYVNTSPGNTQLADLIDASTIGFYNTGYDKLTDMDYPHTAVEDSVDIQLRKLKGEYGTSATGFVPAT